MCIGSLDWRGAEGLLNGDFQLWISGQKNSYWLRMPKDPHKPNLSFQSCLVLKK